MRSREPGQGAPDRAWLAEPGDEVEATLRRALDAATGQTGDEVTRRRIWTRVAEPRLVPARRARWPWTAGLALALAGGAAALALMPARVPPVPGIEAAVVEPLPPAAENPAAKAVPPPVEVARVTPARPTLAGPRVVRTPRHETLRLSLAGGAEAELGGGAVLALDREHHATVRAGQVALKVAKQPAGEHFTVTAGPYRIVVVGTRFVVNMDQRRVGVDVQEGVVEVWKGNHAVRLEAGQGWTGTLRGGGPMVTRVRSLATAAGQPVAERATAVAEVNDPPAAQVPVSPAGSDAPAPAARVVPVDLALHAKRALAAGEPERALDLLRTLSARGGAAGENATYEMGRLLRQQLSRPRDALAVWHDYRTHHPDGLLRTETDLSILETLVSLGEDAVALTEARAFLRRHADSERRAEVEQLVARLTAKATPAR